MKKLLTIALILCTLTASAQMRGGSQFDPGAVRSDLTNITSGSALGVANGGTGATTAAAGLAALGGASLNGSSTVDFQAEDLNVAGVATFTGFTKLGDLATGIKMKVLTGTTAATEGADATVNHALLGDNILDVSLKIAIRPNQGVFANNTDEGYQAQLYHTADVIGVRNHATNSECILSKPFVLVIWYKE